MRAALASHTGLPPDQIPLGRDPLGRPVVGDGSTLAVSVSHSAGLVLVAIASGYRVGVDVERVREGPWLLLPAHALAPRELAAHDRCAPEERPAALLRYWTRKEALLKAAGVGLAVDPRSVQVSAHDAPAGVESLPAELGTPTSWWLADLEVDGYSAALAVSGAETRVLMRSLATPSARPALTPVLAPHTA